MCVCTDIGTAKRIATTKEVKNSCLPVDITFQKQLFCVGDELTMLPYTASSAVMIGSETSQREIAQYCTGGSEMLALKRPRRNVPLHGCRDSDGVA